MYYKIIIFLVLSTLFSGLKNILLKATNFFRGAPPAYTEAVAGRSGLNASNGLAFNEN